jgi:hypothetical protein
MSEIEVDPETGEVIEEPEPEETPEPEPDDDEELLPDDGMPPEPEPEPEPENTGPSLEAIIKLGKSFETYAKKVGDVYEEEAQYLYPCVLCPDNHKGFIDLRSAGAVPGEIAAEVHSFLTGSNVGDFEQDPGTKTCPVCKGKTEVRTGAISGRYITRTCPNCKGYGFMPPPGSEGGTLPHIGNGALAPDEAQAFVSHEDVDEWGEPRLLPDGTVNSNFGMMPNRKTTHPVYGVTSSLTQRQEV